MLSATNGSLLERVYSGNEVLGSGKNFNIEITPLNCQSTEPVIDPCALCKDKCVAETCVECMLDTQCANDGKCTGNKCEISLPVDPCASCKDKCVQGACVECVSNSQCRTGVCTNNRCATAGLTPQACIFC